MNKKFSRYQNLGALIILLCFLMINGCAYLYPLTTPKNLLIDSCAFISNPNDRAYGTYVCNNYEVSITSDPPGAKIEVNNNYLGETPLVYKINGIFDKSCASMVAYPSEAGDYQQQKLICPDALPRQIHFVMGMHAVSPASYVPPMNSYIVGGQNTDSQVRRRMILDSMSSYSGNCPCPYNIASNGSICGGRSAYSRPGGASPLCYETDISDEMVNAYKIYNNLN